MNKRNGFTLVELVISIFLLGIISIFLYTTISNLQKSNELYKNSLEKIVKRGEIRDLLEDDIFLSKDLNLTLKENTIALMRTKNSLFDITMPYIAWGVFKDDDTLLRVESKLPFIKKDSTTSNYYHTSVIGKNCKKFLIYQSNDKKSILVYIKFKDEDPIVYEFPKYSYKKMRDNNETNSSSPHSGSQNSATARRSPHR
jgi:prepilin-type N-terminal cleavage/methylation domain-containing protein